MQIFAISWSFELHRRRCKVRIQQAEYWSSGWCWRSVVVSSDTLIAHGLFASRAVLFSSKKLLFFCLPDRIGISELSPFCVLIHTVIWFIYWGLFCVVVRASMLCSVYIFVVCIPPLWDAKWGDFRRPLSSGLLTLSARIACPALFALAAHFDAYDASECSLFLCVYCLLETFKEG